MATVTVIGVLLIGFCAGYCFIPVQVAFFKFTFYRHDWAYKFPNIGIFHEYVEHEKFRYLYLNRIFFIHGKETITRIALRTIPWLLNCFLAGYVILLYFGNMAYTSWARFFDLSYLLGIGMYCAVAGHYKQLEKTGEHEVYVKWRSRRDFPGLIDFP